jgi:hypothetical protein
MAPGMLPDGIDQPHVGPTLGWAHMVGALALDRGGRRPIDLRRRAELEDLATRFCWALDERRPDILGDALAEDLVWEGSIAGTQALGPLAGRSDYLDWQRQIWDSEVGGQPRHLLLNTLHGESEEGQPASTSSVLLVANRGEAHRSAGSGFLSIVYAREAAGWQIARIFQGWDTPPWRRRLSQMTERERRLHLIQKEDAHD